MNGSLAKVVRGQRRTIAFGGILAGLAIWGLGAFGYLAIGLFFTVGVALELANRLLTELTLLKAVESGELPSRKQYGMGALVRLMGITVIAGTLTVVFWPDGAGVLFGLALFHLIALVLTGIPLLKELRKA